MVHVGEQKTPVTKRIYALYHEKDQHDKCRHKERKHRDSSLHFALCTYCCRLIAVHFSLHIFNNLQTNLIFTFRNQTADNTPDSGNRSMLPRIPSPS